MANTNMTRFGEAAQKKVKRIFAVPMGPEFYAEAGAAQSAGTVNFLVANLPAHAVLTDAYLNVRTVATAATSAKISLGTAEGGGQILLDGDVKAATGIVGTLVKKLPTGTGMAVYAKIVAAGATSSFGDVEAVIEYTEYEKNSGEYTNFS